MISRILHRCILPFVNRINVSCHSAFHNYAIHRIVGLLCFLPLHWGYGSSISLIHWLSSIRAMLSHFFARFYIFSDWRSPFTLSTFQFLRFVALEAALVFLFKLCSLGPRGRWKTFTNNLVCTVGLLLTLEMDLKEAKNDLNSGWTRYRFSGFRDLLVWAREHYWLEHDTQLTALKKANPGLNFIGKHIASTSKGTA